MRTQNDEKKADIDPNAKHHTSSIPSSIYIIYIYPSIQLCIFLSLYINRFIYLHIHDAPFRSIRGCGLIKEWGRSSPFFPSLFLGIICKCVKGNNKGGRSKETNQPTKSKKKKNRNSPIFIMLDGALPLRCRQNYLLVFFFAFPRQYCSGCLLPSLHYDRFVLIDLLCAIVFLAIHVAPSKNYS